MVTDGSFFLEWPHPGEGIYEDCTVAALIALESSPRPRNHLKNHMLTLRGWSQLWCEEETGSLWFPRRPGGTIIAGSSSHVQISVLSTITRESLCLAVQNRWLGLLPRAQTPGLGF